MKINRFFGIVCASIVSTMVLGSASFAEPAATSKPPVSDVFFPWSPEPNPIVAHSDGVTLTFFALHNGFEFEFSGSSNALKR
ncbi:MAG TPA: hypothetical protein VMD59_15760, partial [Acidimicrobiales bacterium]|nr:hypothetical protein [Acidimicrobiales bacterium]